MGHRSDAELLAEAVASPAAFLDVYERHAQTMLRFLVRRVGRDVGEDLLAELFRIAFERRSTFDPSRESPLPWLYGIGANLARRHRRSEERRLRAVARMQREQPNDASTSGTDALESRDMLARVGDAVVHLPDGERDVLLLVVFEELSYDDVATALGIPVGTVRSRLNRARSRLRDLTGESGQAINDRRRRGGVERRRS